MTTLTAERRPHSAKRILNRAHERYPLPSAPGKLFYRGAVYSFKAVDISLGGCCVRTESPFGDGALADVSLTLTIFGIALRIAGMTQWAGKDNHLGIRFLHPSPRSKNQLASLLTCIVDQSAAEVVREVLASAPESSASGAILVPESPKETPPRNAAAPEAETSASHPKENLPAHSETKPVGASAIDPGTGMEDFPAFLHLLNANVSACGSIVDLTERGCRFRCHERFLLDLHVRVELHLRACGLYVQLPGVVHNVLDVYTVDLLFVDLSRRKQEELADMIAELREIPPEVA